MPHQLFSDYWVIFESFFNLTLVDLVQKAAVCTHCSAISLHVGEDIVVSNCITTSKGSKWISKITIEFDYSLVNEEDLVANLAILV